MVNIDGWIKIHRRLLEWEWWGEANVFMLWMYLLLAASHRPKKWRGIELLEGQLVTTIAELSSKTKLSPQQVRSALKKLISTKEITSSATNKYSLISIVNWELYQSVSQIADGLTNKQTTKKQQTNNKQITNKSPSLPNILKNEKKEEGKKESFAEFVSMTNDEYSSLVAKYGEDGAASCIEILDNYKGASGKTYKSDYRAILNWVVKRLEQEGKNTPRSNPATAMSTIYEGGDIF